MTWSPDEATWPHELHYVYELWSGDKCLYVGCSSRLGQRLTAHRRDREWWNDITHIEVNVHPNYVAGRRAEAALIMKLDPTHNKYHAPHYEHPSTSKRAAS
jgi:hypothetical protein